MGVHINKFSDRFVLSRKKIYIALEDVRDIDFIWDITEVYRFDKMWRKKMPLTDIAIELKRPVESVLLLALDRIQRDQVKPRKDWKIW